MIKVALKGLAGRKIRALLTAFAVIIGVSMVSGTFVLTDTMQKSFNAIFETSYENTDVIVSGHQVVESETADVPTIPSSVLRDVRALAEVDAAAGAVDGPGHREGDRPRRRVARPARTRRSCRHRPDPAAAQPAEAREGRWAEGRRRDRDRRRHRQEARLRRRRQDRHVRERAGRAVHDHRHREVRRGRLARRRRDRGLRHPDRADPAPQEGQLRRHLGHRPRTRARRPRFGRPSRSSCPPASTSSSRPRRRRRPPRRPTRASASCGSSCSGFGGIALFVGAFVIFNTLSITVAQRTREFATLRTLGASRKQVLRSVVLEGLVIGLRRLAGRAHARRRHREGHERPVRRLRDRPAERRHRVATRTVVVSLLLGTIITSLEHRPGSPGNPRAADRGCARGLGAAAVEHAEALDEGGARRHRRRRGRDVDGRVRQRPARRRRLRCCSAAACSRCSSAWR